MNQPSNPVATLQAALNVTSLMMECGYTAAANDPDFLRWLYESADLPALERQWTYHFNTYHAEA